MVVIDERNERLLLLDEAQAFGVDAHGDKLRKRFDSLGAVGLKWPSRHWEAAMAEDEYPISEPLAARLANGTIAAGRLRLLPDRNGFQVEYGGRRKTDGRTQTSKMSTASYPTASFRRLALSR
jgi:hypothetical protein